MFSIDEAADLLSQTGYRIAITRLTMGDKMGVKSALIDYHYMVKVKAATDQYKDGLNELGVLSMVQENPSVWKVLFTSNGSPLTPGIVIVQAIICYHQSILAVLLLCLENGATLSSQHFSILHTAAMKDTFQVQYRKGPC